MSDTTVILAKELKTKKIYHVYNLRRDTGYVAKEVFTNGEIKFYPFYYDDRERKVQPKYQTIKYIATLNRKIPSSGLYSEARGYGFTNTQGINNFFRFLDKRGDVQGIVFTDTPTKLKDGVLELNFKDYSKIHFRAKSHYLSKRAEIDNIIKQTFHELLPDTTPEPNKLVHNAGGIERYLSRYALDYFYITPNEAKMLGDILLSSGLSADSIVSTKNQIEIIYIEEVIKEYKEPLKFKQDSKNLEEKWHRFFKTHTWMFSYIFAFPAVYFGDKVSVGGRNFSGNTDKIVDFLYKNDLTNNLAFIEIKTHKTKLVNDTPYRKPDIYSISSHITGAMVQVLDQKTNLLKSYYHKVGTSEIDSLSSTCIIIAGSIESIKSKAKRDSFELFRSGNKDVIVITFDELLKKITTLLSIFTKI